MRREEVPQDVSNLDDYNIKELCYAIDVNGNYTTALSSGWEPKTLIQRETMKQINERIDIAKKAVSEGKSSPIVYFMELEKMDLKTLAAYVGMYQWRVRRHFKPQVFEKLNAETLGRYASVFQISPMELKQFDGK